MTMKGGLIAVIVVAVVMFFADWGFYMIIPPPEGMKEAMGDLMYSMENMPNPAWYFLMEICGAGVLALVLLQRELPIRTAATYGVVVMLAIMGIMSINWGMSLNFPYPVSLVAMEAVYRIIMGAAMGALTVVLAKRFS